MPDPIILEDCQALLKVVDLSFLKGKTVVVTGATGPVGTYLLTCLELLAGQGHSPAAVHALYFNEVPRHLFWAKESSLIKLLPLDLSDASAYRELPRADVVVHAAGHGHSGLFLKNKTATLLVNTAATHALLTKLRPEGKFLFLSSHAVYAGASKSPVSEGDIGTTTPFHSMACYIEGKRAGEAVCDAFRQKGVHVKIARLAAVYGPGARRRDEGALTDFIEQGLLKKRVELKDPGAGSRDYCYVKDGVEALWRILLGGRHAVYNVGGGGRATTQQLARTVGKILETEVSGPADKDPSESPAYPSMDISRFESEFDRKDYTNLEAGLRRMIEWRKAAV